MKKLILVLFLLAVIGTANAQYYDEYGNLLVVPSNTSLLFDVPAKTYSIYDSLSTAVDTLSRIDTLNVSSLASVFSYWHQLIIVCDSNAYISTNASFTAGSTFLLKAGESYTLQKYPVTITNLFMKVSGTGKCLRRFNLSGR